MVFGDKVAHAKIRDEKAIINNANQFIYLNVSVIIDCGVNDFFNKPNRKFYERLLELNINHSYI